MSGGGGPRGPPPAYTWILRLRLDGVVKRRVAVRADLVDPVVGQRRVADLVERVRAEDRAPVPGREERSEDRALVVALGAELADRVHAELGHLVAVDRVRVRML